LTAAIAKSGANVLSVDWREDLESLRNTIGPGIALQGNVDPTVLLGPPEEVQRVTLETAQALGGVGHILNLGHGILQQTPVEHAQLFVETGQRAGLQMAHGA
jgi:uroporphyrinogen decarboxylase